MNKEIFFQLLAENQFDQLFSELKNSPGRYYNDLILLESQWRELRSKERNGTISNEQSTLETARIRKGLLDLIEDSAGHTQEAGSQRLLPRRVPSNRWVWAAGACALTLVLLMAWRSFAQSGAPLEPAPQQAAQMAKPASKSIEQGSIVPKMLEVPANPMSFNKGRIGDITFTFLRAELLEQNPDNWLFRLTFRAKAAYGAHVGGTMLHLAYGAFEKGPVTVNFPGLGPNEAQEGFFEFEVPKAYRDAQLLIYHYSDEPPLASIPFKW